MVRVIFIGNRFAYPDNFAILVYEALQTYTLDGVELVEGGVGGMSLLPYFEDDAKILIVDYATQQMPKIMTQDDIASLQIDQFDHANAFLYLLKSLDRDYTIYLCREEFQETNLESYIEEIVQLIEDLQR
jgi:Ni,Fe-hydrogenase maturation factor